LAGRHDPVDSPLQHAHSRRAPAPGEDSSRMASHLTVDTLGDAVTRALGPRLVALLLYGWAARGTHVPDRSDVNTLLICDGVDQGLFDPLTPLVRVWVRDGRLAPR